MPVLSCPHCGSLEIIPSGESESDICPKLRCGGIMVRHEEQMDAISAVARAIYAVDFAGERRAAQISFRTALGFASVTAEEP